ncbi:glycosyltransferase family 9 protein [Chitinophaga lutea]
MGTSNKQRFILATRFSAFGDVAMTVPVMRQVLEANPDLTIVFATNKNWGALCEGIPRLIFYPADIRGAHNGFKGLFRLFRALRRDYPQLSAVADLHNVLRSQILRTFFHLAGLPIAVIDKGRAGKKALTRRDNKVMAPLETTIARYQQVFSRLGLHFGKEAPIAKAGPGPRRIGVAPFATYREKTYPLTKMEAVISELKRDGEILLFGGGQQEIAQLESLASRHPGVRVVAGKHSLREELDIIRSLSLMISMDSANMHLASLVGVPVVSVWGATHPYAGFMGFGQAEENAVQIDLYCRPCSVFGNKPCYRGDHACMEQLAPERIVDRVRQVLRG